MSKRKKYSPEFKWEAIELVRRSGASCRQVALEIKGKGDRFIYPALNGPSWPAPAGQAAGW